MDRDTLIGITLISLILVVWMYWMSPTPPEPSDQTQDTVATDTQVPPSPDTDTSALAEGDTSEAQAAPTELGLDLAQEGETRTITVKSDLYTADFSTKGATLTSLILDNYQKFDQETPVQLVNSKQGALSLNFFSSSNRPVDTRNILFSASVDQDTLRVGEEPVQLTFQVDVGEGSLQQTYTFKPETYEIELDVQFNNPRSFAQTDEYELTWNGGIPPTEGDATTEAQASGAYAQSGGEVVSVTLGSEKNRELPLTGSVEWAAVKSKFFTATLIPQETTEGGILIGNRQGELETPSVWEDYTVGLIMPRVEDGTDSYKLYLGPIEYNRLSQYNLGLYNMVDYGYDFLEWFTRPLAKWVIIPSFHFLSRFIPSYGLIIVIFAILIKVLLYPLTKKSYTSMAKMSDLQPKMQEIKEKYEDNAQKQQEAMMKLYRNAGVNPLGGCLPMLLQFPFIIALWRFFPSSIEIRQQSFLWANDLSAPDIILNLPFTIPFYGDYVAGFTLLMGLSMLFTMRIQSAGSAGGGQMKALQYLFPVMIFAIFNRFAAGLSLYYLVYNIVTALQQMYIKRVVSKDDEEEGPTAGKNIQRGRPKQART